MTFDEFKIDFIAFLDSSTVNLGRKGTKTRQAFIATVVEKFDAFAANIDLLAKDKQENKQEDQNLSNKSVMRIKPLNSRQALDIGQGVHSMTASESARADEQLGRSPFVVQPKKGVENDSK